MPECHLVPELSVSNLEKSLWFYQNVIGFKIEFERQENKFAYMSFFGSELMLEEDRQRTGDAALWIVEPLDYPRGRGLNISIDCPDVGDLVDRLTGANIPLRKEVEDCWYRDNDTLHGQRSLLVQDPDGYLLRFAQSLGTKPVGK